MLVDTHVHFKNIQQVQIDIAKAQEQGVEFVIAVASDLGSSRIACEIAKLIKNIEASVGVHPHEAAKDEKKIEAIKEVASSNEVAAIGECGLDYHYMYSPKGTQQKVFIEQIRIAKELNKPLIVHSRQGMEETLSILRDEGIPQAGCVLHCFSGNLDQAEEAISLGCYLAFGGVITFKNSSAARVASQAPLSAVVLETDSPYLAPEPYRGKPNSPAYLPIVAGKLAELKGVNIEEVAEQTTKNAVRLFHLDK